DYQNRIATANFGYRFSPRTQLRTTVRNDTAGGGVPGPTARLFPDPDERTKRKHLATGTRLEDQTTKFWHQSLGFFLSESNYSNFDPVAQDLSKPNTPLNDGTAFNDLVSSSNNHQRRRGLRYQSDFLLPTSHFLSAGIDYEQEHAVFDSGFAGKNRVPVQRRNIGTFIQDQFSYGPRLFITPGIRIENNRADVPTSFAKLLEQLRSQPCEDVVGFGTEFVPKIAAIYVVRTSGLQSRRGATRLKVNWGRGIKAPSLIEAFSPDPRYLGNPELKPERSLNFDIGIDQFFFRDRVRFEVTYFENRFRNQIAFVSDPATSGGPITLNEGRLTNFVNNDRTRTRGYEFSGVWHPRRFLQLGGSYTYLSARLEAAAHIFDSSTGTLVPNREVGLPLLHRPKHSGAINFGWIGEKLDVNLDSFFIGKRRDIDPVLFTHFDASGNA